jgi:hypothetical protein
MPTPANITLVVTATRAEIEIDAATLTKALAELKEATPIIAALPKGAAGPDKKTAFTIIAARTCPPTTNQRIVTLIAQAMLVVFGDATTPLKMSPVRAVYAPFKSTMDTYRLDQSLMACVAEKPFPRVNERLEKMRIRALSRIPQAVLDVLKGERDVPADDISAYGLKYALLALLAPVLASELSSQARQSVSVGQALDILEGGDEAEEHLAYLEK